MNSALDTWENEGGALDEAAIPALQGFFPEENIDKEFLDAVIIKLKEIKSNTISPIIVFPSAIVEGGIAAHWFETWVAVKTIFMIDEFCQRVFLHTRGNTNTLFDPTVDKTANWLIQNFAPIDKPTDCARFYSAL